MSGTSSLFVISFGYLLMNNPKNLGLKKCFYYNSFTFFRPRFQVQFSVFMMIFGVLVAAFNDLAFNLPGYTYILLNDVCTAGNGVVTKKKLDAKDLGRLLLYIKCIIWAYLKI